MTRPLSGSETRLGTELEAGAATTPPAASEELPTGALMDLVGPLAVAPAILLLFSGHASPTRIWIAAFLQIAITLAFGLSAEIARRRGQAQRFRIIDEMWVVASGLLAASIPWIVATSTAGGYFAVAFLFCAIISIDTIFSAFRPNRYWNLVLTTTSLSVVGFLLANGQWRLAAPVAVLSAVLVGAHDAIESLVHSLRKETAASHRLAEIDPLTGIANRRRLHAFIQRAAAQRSTLVVASVDVDDFKRINDRFGHAGGDAALVGFATFLSDALGPSWLCVRSGGDEFICVSTDGTTERVRAALRSVPSQKFEGTMIPMSVSAGIAEGQAADALLADASAALRLSKNQGKRTITIVDEDLRAEFAHLRQLGTGLADAIEQRRIEAWAQPIMDISPSSGPEVHSYECLARWTTTDGIAIPPSTFIPMVEDQRLTRELGELMIDSAGSLIRKLGDGARVAVNISASHFVDRAFVPYLHRTIERYEIDPGSITIEITESEDAPSTAAALGVARQLRSMGVGLAIDDFGTGYGTLERLLSFPCTQLKLDRTIIANVAGSGIEHLLAGFGVMSTEAGIEIVAEGVETPDQAALLGELGIRLAQGFLYGRPVPLHEVVDRALVDEPGATIV